MRSPVSNEDLSIRLAIPEEKLAQLNDVNENHRYGSGDWLVLPSQKVRTAKQLTILDTSEVRLTPPLEAPPPFGESAVVRFGDTLFKIAQRYGLTLGELLRLNPGMETARLVVGSPIRLAQSAPVRPRMVLGLRPSGSGGISWPALPPNFIGSSALYAWRVNQQGVLELRTSLDVAPRAFYDSGGASRGPRVWIDLPGAPSHSRTITGSDALKEVRIDRLDGETTRMVFEFLPGTRIDWNQLRLVGIARNRWRMKITSSPFSSL